MRGLETRRRIRVVVRRRFRVIDWGEWDEIEGMGWYGMDELKWVKTGMRWVQGIGLKGVR
jgi:hypothetical protein